METFPRLMMLKLEGFCLSIIIKKTYETLYKWDYTEVQEGYIV